MDRRRFLKTAAGAAGVIAASQVNDLQSAGGRRISIVRDPNCITMGQVDEYKVAALLNKLLQVHYDVADPAEVFRQIFSNRDRIGIKVNCLSGRRLSTHLEIPNYLVGQLKKIGIPGKNIIIWERLNADLRQAGYPIQIPAKNQDVVSTAGCDILGYDSELTIHRSIGSLFAKTVSELCTATINIPVLKDHGIVGVTLGMKNMFGAIHNPNKYHHNQGDPYVADLYSHPDIGGKIRMSIIDALEVQCEGGPPYQADWCEDYGGLITSNDPVALDSYGWKMIEDMREAKGLPSLKEAGRQPTYIGRAAELNLGTDDLKAVEVRQN